MPAASDFLAVLPMIRIFQHGDHLAIARIFSTAIHEIASEVYTVEQCLAWSAREADYAYWRNRCEVKRPFVAEVKGQVAGFLELDPDGHIDCAAIHPKFRRKGITSALVKHAVGVSFAFGLDRIFVEASICAKPMFERLGFSLMGEQVVMRRGVGLLNYRMELCRENAVSRGYSTISET